MAGNTSVPCRFRIVASAASILCHRTEIACERTHLSMSKTFEHFRSGCFRSCRIFQHVANNAGLLVTQLNVRRMGKGRETASRNLRLKGCPVDHLGGRTCGGLNAVTFQTLTSTLGFAGFCFYPPQFSKQGLAAGRCGSFRALSIWLLLKLPHLPARGK